MKSLKLQRLSLLSRRERKARIELFDRGTNVVLGSNDTGKSCLIKSIYETLGAPAARVNPRWREANAISRLDFSIDDTRYAMVRSGTFFGLFDASGNMLWTHTGITSDVGPRVAELLDFKIQLATKNGDVVVPPPAFCFLPFYIDQDAGWQTSWSSFASLQMIPGYKRDIIEFHTGIRPKEYYSAKLARDEAQKRREELLVEKRALERAAERIQSRRPGVGLDFRPELFEDQIKRLISRVSSLEEEHGQIRREIGGLQNRKAVLTEEVSIAQSALRDLEADFSFVQHVDVEIICPTCGTQHDNDFAAKFGLLADADTCRSIVADSTAELEKVNGQLSSSLRRLGQYQKQIDEINGLLEEVRGDVKLRDMLEDESERILGQTIEEEQGALDQSIGLAAVDIENAAAHMASLEGKGRKRIQSYFAARIQEFAQELNVQDTIASSALKVDMTVRDTGSDLPRAQLAYYYAILHTIREFSTACICPVIVDTPLQQDQDSVNSERMIRFAVERCPADMQLVLGTVQLHGVPVQGNIIETTEKYSLLQGDQYEEASLLLDPLTDQMLGQGTLRLS